MPEISQKDAWTVPGAHPVGDGVFRLPIPLPGDGLKAVNVYAIVHEDSITLIDSGWEFANAQDHLRRALSNLGAELHDVKRFLVTHVHRDHYTLAVAVRRRLGTPIYLGEGERQAVARASDSTWNPELDHRAFMKRHGAHPLLERLDPDGVVIATHDSNEWEPPDGWIRDGQVLDVGARELVAVATPGHTRGHTVFVDEAQGLLFAGDHVLPHITPAIGFEPEQTDKALVHYLASLQLVRSMPDRVLLPAHGPVVESAHARIDELLSHHGVRLAATLAALEAGARSAFEVSAQLPWTSRQRSFAELDVYNQFLAVMETYQHLGFLVARGDAEAHSGPEDSLFYTAAIKDPI